MQDIEALARTLREEYSFLSLEELIEALGITLRVLPAEAEILNGDPACYAKIFNRQYIFLSSACPAPQQAFVLAHELGHALLHDVELAHYKTLFKTGKEEREADRFAVCLLALKRDETIGNTEEEYVRAYGIREEAVKYMDT